VPQPRRIAASDANLMRRPRHGLSPRLALLAIVLTLPLVVSELTVVSPAVADELQDRIAATRARQEEIDGAIARQQQLLGQLKTDEGIVTTALDTTSDQLEGINADQAAVRAEIAAATDALARVEARYAALTGEIEQLDWTIGLLEAEIAQGDEDLEARRALLADRLAAAYRTRQTSLLEQVLASSSFTDILTDVDAFLRFGDQDAELAAAIERDQTALASMRRLADSTRYRTDQLRTEAMETAEEMRSGRERLQRAQEGLAALEARTERILEQQRAAWREIASDQDAARAEIERHEASEARLQSELQALIAEAQRRAEEERRRREEAQRRAEEAQRRREAEERRRERERDNEPRPEPPPSGNGMMIWPTSGVVTQEYGCTGFAWEPPRGSCAHFHDGIDISNADGTPIRAAMSGVVTFVGYNPYDGDDPAWIVGIAHGSGLETWYSHLLPRYAPGVRSGSSVSKGQTIGYMGNTGRSTGTHLHWEVVRNGSPQNPRAYL
jgi:murein DD-endopeptidase MepM/ murein hydrolase activator NlpD